MIDFIKINRLPVNIDELLENPLLRFTTQISVRTGEIYEERPMIAKYDGFTIIIKSDSRGKRFAKMSGSLHMFGNKGEHNHDQYDYNKMVNDINRLCRILNVNANEVILNGFEFGVNVEIPYDPDEFIYNVIDHKGIRLNESRERNKYFRDAKHSNYRVKLYNKSKQHGLSHNLLRIEIHCNRMHHLKGVGIKTLGDLLNKEKLDLLGQLLLSHLNDLLINDIIGSPELINSRDKKVLSDGTNNFYWDKLKKDQPFNYPKKRKRFTELIQKYGANNYRETIRSLIVKTWNSLLNPKVETVHELTILEKHYFTGINNWYNRLNQVILSQSQRKQCPITNIDITHQKDESRFVSEKTILFIYRTNQELFKWLLKKYYPSHPVEMSVENICYYIAHNIRNKVSVYLRSRRVKELVNMTHYKMFDEDITALRIRKDEYMKSKIFNSINSI